MHTVWYPSSLLPPSVLVHRTNDPVVKYPFVWILLKEILFNPEVNLFKDVEVAMKTGGEASLYRPISQTLLKNCTWKE